MSVFEDDSALPPDFSENRYQRWYFALMERAANRVLTDDFERHHVIPKSLGGPDRLRVKLTYREHFLAHWLLTKFVVGERRIKVVRALACMTMSRNGRIRSSWQFAVARKAKTEATRGQRFALGCTRSEETRAKMSAAARRRGPETREKLSRLARNRSAETREKLRLAATNLSAEVRAKRSAAAARRRHTQETKDKLSRSAKGNKRCVGRQLSVVTKEKIGAASRAYQASRRETNVR